MSNSKLRAKEDAPRENNREPALDWGVREGLLRR